MFHPPRPQPETDKVIVLDIDWTMINAVDVNPVKLQLYSNPDNFTLRSRCRKVFFSQYKYWAILRPYLYEFLEAAFRKHKYVIVWTAGSPDYAKAAVETIFTNLPYPDLVLDNKFCEEIPGSSWLHKPIEKISKKKMPYVALWNTYLVDDRAINGRDNPQNIMVISEYAPTMCIDDICKEDDSLLQLMEWWDTEEFMSGGDIRDIVNRPF